MNSKETFPASSQGSASTRTTATIRRAASDLGARAKEQATHLATEQKDTAAEKIGGYSSRLRATARSAESEDPNIAHFADQAADRLESWANYVRETDLDQIKQDVAGIARRHPALFLGGALVAGLVLGSVVKASVQSLQDNESDDGPDFDEEYSDGTDFPETAGAEADPSANELRGPSDREGPVVSEFPSSATP